MALLATGIWLVGPRATDDYSHRLPFDPNAWRSPLPNDDQNWPARLRMVDDLVGSKRLDGLTREQVQELLGPGDSTGKWQDWDLVYYLGPERGLIRIDSEWLVIKFASSGHVSHYRVAKD